MAYIGVSPSNGVRRKHTYTATAAQTSFSGAGAEGITLGYLDSNYVDVYQNGVKLSEADYTSTSGTAIVLAQGASVSDMIEVVVYDVFSVADTVSKSAGGTFDGNITAAGTLAVTGDVAVDTNVLKVDTSNNRVGINVTSPSRTLQIAGNGNRVSSFTHSGDYAFSTFSDQNTSDDGQVRAGAYGNDLQLFAGGSARIIADSNGHVTMPAQPAFNVNPTSTQSNVAEDDTIVFGTERFDQNGDFASNTFTAPVTGKYQFTISLRVDNIDTAANWNRIELVTSNYTYLSSILDLGGLSADPLYWHFNFSVLADMDANDTALVKWGQNIGASQADVVDQSSFSGYLVA